MKNIILLLLFISFWGRINVIASGMDTCIADNPGNESFDDISFTYHNADPSINPRIRVIIVDCQGNVIRETNTRKDLMPEVPELMRNILRKCDLIMEDSQTVYYLLAKKIELQTPDCQHDKKYLKKTFL